MSNQQAIASLRTLCHNCELFPKCVHEKPECFQAIELAISALQAQEAKAQLSAEGTTSDLISRQDAIEVIEEMQMPIMRSMFPEEQFVFKGMSEALSAIKDLPSAHPEIEERKEESAQNVPKEDLISRKAAIEALWEIRQKEISDGRRFHDYCSLSTAVDVIKDLPSAQPEPLVKESRTLVKDLVKEPCEDAVSREAAIDVAENAFSRGLLASPDIRKLPSVQPEPQWIPVSERLPESKPEDLEYPTVIACCEDGEVMTACYYESTKEWGIGENYDRKINPVAWMPLPEPYRAERRTDDANDIT